MNRAALHEDNRMMSIFTGHSRGQTSHEFCLCQARDEFTTVRANVMAFIYDKMPVFCHTLGEDEFD